MLTKGVAMFLVTYSLPESGLQVASRRSNSVVTGNVGINIITVDVYLK